MITNRSLARYKASLIAVTIPACLSGCGVLNQGFLGAAGPVAAEQRELFWIVAAILAFVAGPVLILTPVIAWHYRHSNTKDAYRPEWNFSWTLEGFIWIPPVLIVILLAVLLWNSTQRLDPYRPIGGGEPLKVQVIAADWKWLFIYPDSGVASFNRLMVPAGRPVQLSLTSMTVMQSLMIPRLTGQIYTMAGMTTHMNLQADRAGRFQGRNMQYNDDGFAHQSFTIEALEPISFASWLSDASRSAPAFEPSGRALLAERAVVAAPHTFSNAPAVFFASVAAGDRGHTDMHELSR